MPLEVRTTAIVQLIRDRLQEVEYAAQDGVLAIEDSPQSAAQQAERARSICRLCKDILRFADPLADSEPTQLFRNIMRGARDAKNANPTQVRDYTLVMLEAARQIEQLALRQVATQLVADNAEGHLDRFTDMTRSGSSSEGATTVIATVENAGEDISAGDAEGQESLQTDPDRGLTSLHLAAENGSAEVTQLLVADPAAIHAETRRGRRPLHGAAAQGQVPTLQLLLASGAVVNAADVLGTTALHLAVTHGSTEAVEVLLDHHADLSSADLFGQQPLHYAARHGLAAVVQILLARGADAAAQDACNKTARDLATENLFEEVAQLLS